MYSTLLKTNPIYSQGKPGLDIKMNENTEAVFRPILHNLRGIKHINFWSFIFSFVINPQTINFLLLRIVEKSKCSGVGQAF